MEFFEELLRQAPDSLIKEIVLGLFPTEGGSGFSGLMLTLNTVIMFIAVLLFLFQVGTHIISYAVAKAEAGDSNSDGVSLINENTVVGYIRSVIAIAILIPIPGSGLNLFNHLVITVMLAGSNLAQMGWDKAFESMFADPVETTQVSFSEPRNLGMQLFEANVCDYYLQIETTGRASNHKFMEDGLLEFSGRDTWLGSTTHCGVFEMNDMTEAVPLLSGTSGSAVGTPDMMPINFENAPYRGPVNSFAQDSHGLFNQLQASIFPIAQQFALSMHPRTAADYDAPNVDSIVDVLYTYERQLITIHTSLKRDIFTIINNNRQVSEAAKWYNAPGYMRRLSNANFISNKLRDMSVPSAEPTHWQRVWSNPPDHVLALTNNIKDFLNQGQPNFVQFTQKNEWQEGAATDSSMLQSLLMKFLNDSLIQYSISHDEDIHPLTSLMDDGSFFLTSGAAIAVAQTVLAGIPVIGNLVEGTSQWLTPIMWLFIVAGVMMGDILPLIPWFFGAMALFSWLILGATTFVAGSLWVAFHVRIRSKKITFGTGWVALLELFLRPLVILVALWLSFEIFIASSKFLAATFSNALNNLQFSSIKVIVSYAFQCILYSFLQIAAAIASFWIINTLPGELSARIPHDGDPFGGSD